MEHKRWPIVLFDNVGKVFEIIVTNRIVKLNKRIGPILRENQFGFLKERSTVHVVLRVKAIAQEALSQDNLILG